MGNVSFGYPNRIDSATLSGQGFAQLLPLSYLTARQLAQVARTYPLPYASIFASFASATDVQLAALAAHTLGTSGKWRLRGYSSDPRPYQERSSQIAKLDLRFDLDIAVPGLTCTRAGATATYWGSDGFLKTAAANTARITYDPATLDCLGLLVEDAATNNVQYCRDLTNAYWTKTSATVALTATGIDGAANSATRVTATGSNATVSRGTVLCGQWSVYIRRVSGTGAVTISTNNWASSTTCTLTTSWQRFSRSGAYSGAETVGVRMATSGDVIEVDYCQAEQSVVSQPILTTGSTASRAADSISYSIDSRYQPSLSSGALAAVWRHRIQATGSTPEWLRLANGTSYVSLSINGSSTSQVLGTYVDAGVSQAAMAAVSSPAVDEECTVAMSWAANAYALCVKAGTVTTDATGTVSSLSASTITIASGGNFNSVVVRRLTLFPSAMSSADVQTLSTSWSLPAAGYDSGTLDAWPAEWTAGTSAEQRSDARGLAMHQPASTQTYRYWRIDAWDATASAIEIGRIYLGGLWTPTWGGVYGASLGYQARESVQESDSGAEFFVDRPNPRVVSLDIQAEEEDVAMGYGLEMQRQLGTTGELLFRWSASDRLHQPRRAFLARLQSLRPPVAVGYRLWSLQCDIKELL